MGQQLMWVQKVVQQGEIKWNWLGKERRKRIGWAPPEFSCRCWMCRVRRRLLQHQEGVEMRRRWLAWQSIFRGNDRTKQNSHLQNAFHRHVRGWMSLAKINLFSKWKAGQTAAWSTGNLPETPDWPFRLRYCLQSSHNSCWMNGWKS